jgi:hypothetical protein
VSACVVCLYGAVTLLALVRYCPFRVDVDQQLYAVAWPSSVDMAVWLVQRLI